MDKLMITEYPRFKEMFSVGGKTKKYKSDLQSDAKKWFESSFDIKFSLIENTPRWYYSCGMLMIGFPKIGSYYFAFVVKMIHFEMWQVPEWKEGFKYGRRSLKDVTQYRDGNPYSEANFYSNAAWDAGYIMGLANFSFNHHTQLKQNEK